MASFGMDVASLGVRDIVLPGDMKTILSKLDRSRKIGAGECDSSA
jgi:hypothetical protein